MSTLYADCTAAARKDFANINALVRRLVAGEQLSNSSFPKEPPGFAFKAGRIRFYGVYSKKHLRCFVMSHAVRKLHDKLEVQDREKMQKCLDEFDALPQLPQQNHGTT